MENKLFKVGLAEVLSGHVFNHDFTLYQGEGDYYKYFGSLKEAILFSNQLVKDHPEFECSVSNESDEMVYFKSVEKEQFY